MVSLKGSVVLSFEQYLPKVKDRGSFSILSSMGDISISWALCDLGVSVSLIPYSICKKLQVRNL